MHKTPTKHLVTLNTWPVLAGSEMTRWHILNTCSRTQTQSTQHTKTEHAGHSLLYCSKFADQGQGQGQLILCLHKWPLSTCGSALGDCLHTTCTHRHNNYLYTDSGEEGAVVAQKLVFVFKYKIQLHVDHCHSYPCLHIHGYRGSS